MTTICSLLARDLQQKIEEVIKVEQTDEQVVYTEIAEYVATDRVQDEYSRLFRAIAELPAESGEGIGVWISGFFGSGKSSFAKNIGFALANAPVLGRPAGELLAEQINNPTITALIDSINSRIPTEVIMFDVRTAKFAVARRSPKSCTKCSLDTSITLKTSISQSWKSNWKQRAGSTNS